jgi:FkbM family methyltransferase
MRQSLPVIVVTVAALLAFVGLSGSAYHAGRAAAARELQPYVTREVDTVRGLANRYGQTVTGAEPEEWIVRDFFQDRRAGVFVDVGANDARDGNTTYYLETRLEWSGLAIEPQTRYAARYAAERPRTTFIPLFVSDHAEKSVSLFVPRGQEGWASANRAHADGHGAIEVLATESATLDEILQAHHVERIDFLSIDVEEHEPQVLGAFSVDRYRPQLVCIEAWPSVRQAILNYFTAHRYALVGSYLRMDTGNLWFEPLASP